MNSSGVERAFRPLSVRREGRCPPPGWRWRQLSELARLESGHTPSRRRPEWWGGDIPWIALPDIRALDGRTAYETAEYTNPDGITNSAARVLPAGTVVLSRTASVGFITVMGRPMATSQDFVNWVCGPELEPWFLGYLLISCRDYIRSLASGAVHKTVYVPIAKAFYICAPDVEKQRQIVSSLQAQLQVVARAQVAASKQLEEIQELPATLLRTSFSISA